MKLPGYDHAIVPERTITHYLLSFTQTKGKSKAEFFTNFGFTADEWQVFADALLRHASEHEVASVETNDLGILYVIEGPLHTPDERMPEVRSVWFVAHDTAFPILTTAYPLKRRRTRQ